MLKNKPLLQKWEISTTDQSLQSEHQGHSCVVSTTSLRMPEVEMNDIFLGHLVADQSAFICLKVELLFPFMVFAALCNHTASSIDL